MKRIINANDISIGRHMPLVLIAGPCVIENYETCSEISYSLKEMTEKVNIPFIFKASYDKANRTSVNSFRGPGIKKGLKILDKIKSDLNVAILSDVHRISEITDAAKVLDIIQIPAFLCRQTDIVVEAAKTGKPVNIKKGQFLAPWDVINIIKKIESTGNYGILITERGTMFGYNNLVVDFRSIPVMQDTGYPVIFDATHSIQLPGGKGDSSGGQREFVPTLAKAAVAAGADAIFLEVHPEPDKALCDSANSLRLDDLEELLIKLKEIKKVIDAR